MKTIKIWISYMTCKIARKNLTFREYMKGCN